MLCLEVSRRVLGKGRGVWVGSEHPLPVSSSTDGPATTRTLRFGVPCPPKQNPSHAQLNENVTLCVEMARGRGCQRSWLYRETCKVLCGQATWQGSDIRGICTLPWVMTASAWASLGHLYGVTPCFLCPNDDDTTAANSHWLVPGGSDNLCLYYIILHYITL